jgi:hypothetical protein
VQDRLSRDAHLRFLKLLKQEVFERQCIAEGRVPPSASNAPPQKPKPPRHARNWSSIPAPDAEQR